MMRHRGFTLLEVLIVICVAAVLVTVLFPVVSKAKERAKISRSLQQMRQIHAAMVVYMQDYESGPAFLGGLGLPPSMLTLLNEKRIPSEIVYTGGTSNAANKAVYVWMPPGPQDEPQTPSWSDYYQIAGSNCVLLVDETYGPNPSARFETLTKRFLLAIHLDGHVSENWAYGDYTQYSWWLKDK